MLKTLLVMTSLIALPCASTAQPIGAASHVAPSHSSAINNDAMTMSDCQKRLALPKSARPKDDDPRIDLDGVCKNMLSPTKAKIRNRAASGGSH